MKNILLLLFILSAAFVYSQSADSTKQDSCKIIIPNVIRGNGDGLNLFRVTSNCAVSAFTVTIFDRWGQKVYGQDFLEKNNMVNWEFEKSSVRQGTYYWIIECTFNHDIKKEKTFKGFLTLIK